MTAGFRKKRTISSQSKEQRDIPYSSGATAFIRQPVSFTRSFSLRQVSRVTCLHLAAVA